MTRYDPSVIDLFKLAHCGITAFGTPVHVHGSTPETWQRCQCGAREAEIIDCRIVVRDVTN